MAYARYSRTCEWYVFWYTTKEDDERARRGHPKSKAEETLAIWHSAHRAEGPVFRYAEVTAMLERSDFSRVPGFTDADRGVLREWLSAFVSDVDAEHGER
jgi:hypothetical protein